MDLLQLESETGGKRSTVYADLRGNDVKSGCDNADDHESSIVHVFPTCSFPSWHETPTSLGPVH